MNAAFSVVVTCYNFEDYIAECLDSILNQDYPAECLDVICVDDGSTDGSTECMKSYARRFKNIRHIRTENSGLEKSCNRGILEARFERIVRVDADDELAPGYFQAMSRAISENPKTHFLYCKKYFEVYSEKEKFLKELPVFDKEEIFSRGDFFATGTVYQKKDLQAAGLFPEAIKNCGLENYTVILTFLSQGKAGLAVPDALFHYRRHHANMSTLKRQAIIQYGQVLLARHGRKFLTNENHPYRLKLESIREAIR